jgi:transposase
MEQIKNIFRDGNQRFKVITNDYSLNEVLVVPIEIGKFNSKATIANMYGDLVVDNFIFSNNQRGYRFLKERVDTTSKSNNAKLVFVGMEGTGHYHENLAMRLKSDGYTVDIIHPYDSKHERENKNAKTDEIDLMSIARMLITNKGRRCTLAEETYSKLQVVSRGRRKLVYMRTALKNRITSLVDRIFPGYWPKDEEIFSNNWGKGSLLVLEHYPHPEKVTMLGVKRLTRFLKKHNTKLGEETARKLVQAAKDSLSRPFKDMDSHSLTLKCLINTYKSLNENIEKLEEEMALLLIQTPGTYLLSIPGISVIYAAELMGELGDISRFAHPKQIMSFAGNVPYVSQSAEYEAKGLPLTKKGSSSLRPLLNQIALSLNTHCPQFGKYYQKKYLGKSDRPGIAKIGTANKFLRLAFCLLKNQKLFVPQGFDACLMSYKDYYREVFEQIRCKLYRYKMDPSELTRCENNYFLKIKAYLEDTYDLKLNSI